MIHPLRHLIAGTLVAFALCGAADDLPDIFSKKPSARARLPRDQYYAPPEKVMRRLLQFEKKNRTIQHFCVVGYRWADGNVVFWVHWKEEERLMLWRGDSAFPEMGLVYARRNLKLGRDTVESQSEINGSTYLETRAWWESVAKDCEIHGEKFVIRPLKAE